MYALVSADFPEITSIQREKIYERLKNKNWEKFENVGRDITTCWYANFDSVATDSGIIQTTINEFRECSNPYCRPKLVIHIGINKPVEINT